MSKVWEDVEMNYPKMCPMCGKSCGSDIHATCEWKWADEKRQGKRSFNIYREEMEAFSKWYAEKEKNNGRLSTL